MRTGQQAERNRTTGAAAEVNCFVGVTLFIFLFTSTFNSKFLKKFELFSSVLVLLLLGGPGERSVISTVWSQHLEWRRSKRSRAFQRDRTWSLTGLVSVPLLVWIRKLMKASADTSAPLLPCAEGCATSVRVGVKVII